ncbi:GMC oxidoreductase [Xylariales sp. AK1849]|nr:GMC oxidoreductase [Xylariales sp. AK1849]
MNFYRCALSFAFLAFTLCACTLINIENGTLPSYDYIIVGAGIGGLVVANRLSQDPEVTILLIEAGLLQVPNLLLPIHQDDGSDQVNIPGLIGFDNPVRYDANLTTASQEFIGNRTLTFGQGKVVGGSTVLNGQCWTRGSRDNIDAWKELGNPGWGWNDLLPYFMRSENYTTNVNDTLHEALHIHPPSTDHGTHGPVQVGYPNFFYNQSRNFLDGVRQLGIPFHDEPNRGVTTGASVIPSSMSADNQSRSDGRTAYLDPALSRPNLYLLTGHTVTQLLSGDELYPNTTYIPGVSGTLMTGVELAANSTAPKYVISCKKETILAAGAIFSPVLLQISGIGPRVVLEDLGVKVIVDLPGVGRNFQDHPAVQILYNYTAPPDLSTAESIQRDSGLRSATLDEYTSKRTGPWTSPMVNTVAFTPLRWVMNATEHEQHIIKASTNATSHLPDSYDDTLLAGYAEQQSILISLMSGDTSAAYELMSTSWGKLSLSSMQPFSRGIVQAVSSSIFNNTPPVIDPRYCSDPLDCDVIALGLRFNARLIQTSPMAALKPIAQAGFGPDEVHNATALNEALRAEITTGFHPGGTTAMLPRNKGGVVDPSLRVYGTKNLRVVDAGVIPLLPDAHIQAAIYAIAEKASCLG